VLDEKLQALAAKVTATKATGPLAVLEAAFKIIPGKEAAFLAYQASVVPLAAAQPGFRAGYSGPVWDTTWVYFGARFDSEEQMNAWHGEPQHRVIQKSAPNWWTSLYLRKWRPPMPGEVLGDRLMSETSILVDTALDDTQIQSVRQALAELGAAGAQPFETLTGEFEAHPFQFSGPLLVAPAADKVPYLLTTHWSSADHFNAWKSSSSYRALQSLGDVSSELFVPLVETRPREHLRDDKLQRDWEWTLEDRRNPAVLAAVKEEQARH
jgi:heme-degrading monooxygenase HmoA